MHGCNVPNSLWALAVGCFVLALMCSFGAWRLRHDDRPMAWLILLMAVCCYFGAAVLGFVIYLCMRWP